MEISERRCADECGRVRTSADGVAAREMGGGKIEVDMNKRSCATIADGVGAMEWRVILWGEEASGHERARLRGRVRTVLVKGNGGKYGWGERRGRDQ